MVSTPEPVTERRILRGAAVLAFDGRRTVRRTDLLLEGGRIAAIGGVGADDTRVTEVRGVLIPGLVQAYLPIEWALSISNLLPALEPHQRRLQSYLLRRALDSESVALLAACAVESGLRSGVIQSLLRLPGGPGEAVIEGARSLGGRVVVASPTATQSEVVADPSGEPRGRVLLDERYEKWIARGRWPKSAVVVPNEAVFSAATLAEWAAANVSVVLTPSQSLCSGAPWPQVAALWSAGVNVALGSGHGLGLPLLAEARLLARVLRGQVEQPASLALEAATRGGARALGLTAGTIEVGQPADLVLLGVEVEASDDHETVARRILIQGASAVRAVWSGGDSVLREERLLRGSVPADQRQRLEARLRAAPTDELRTWWAQFRDALSRKGRIQRGYYQGSLLVRKE